jgi:glycerol-3-phosphate dehydrogenase subunit C
MASNESLREGGIDAPTRHPLDWQSADFGNRQSLYDELERVFDICHGCRRCVSLCQAFPALFDLVDESETLEVDGIDRGDYMKVIDQCYLCDLCYQTKCPYVPPHEWNLDFPHLMLRAKAYKFNTEGAPLKHRILTNTTTVGKLATLPIVVKGVNAANKNPSMRKLLSRTLGVHPQASVPGYHRPSLEKRVRKAPKTSPPAVKTSGPTRGRVALFGTCYCNYNLPQLGEDLLAVFRHNGIETRLLEKTRCCGMPKLELGDLASAAKLMKKNIPIMKQAIEEGFDIVTAIPSCTLMFKQELPLMFPEDPDVQQVRQYLFDPFEYLSHRHRGDLLDTNFKNGLGKIAYHVPCHQRVQNIGPKTRDILALIPNTEISMIERCSGHDGTYGVRNETYEAARKIARPVVNRIKKTEAERVTSDCPMAAEHLQLGLQLGQKPLHPMTLLRQAYGI